MATPQTVRSAGKARQGKAAYGEARFGMAWFGRWRGQALLDCAISHSPRKFNTRHYDEYMSVI